MRYNKREATFAFHSSSPPTSLMSNAIMVLPDATTCSNKYNTWSASKPPATGVPVPGHNFGSKPSMSKLK